MRKPLFLLCPAILALACTANAQNLAEIAKAEEARRKELRAPAKVYTNDTLRGLDGGTPPAPAPVAAPAAGIAKPEAAAKAATQKTEENAKDEKYWRGRITAARTELKRSQTFHDALQSQINGLYAEFVSVADPAQRAVVEQKRQGAIAEQDRLKADITRLTKAIADIEEEARRAGVPPGWLR